jgi:hypothetical protein
MSATGRPGRRATAAVVVGGSIITAMARVTAEDDEEIIDQTRDPFLTPASCGAIPSRGYRLSSP